MTYRIYGEVPTTFNFDLRLASRAIKVVMAVIKWVISIVAVHHRLAVKTNYSR